MDEIERAQQETERFLRASLKKHREQQENTLQAVATGHCLNCNEPLTQLPEHSTAPRWCDADCRDGWEKRELK